MRSRRLDAIGVIAFAAEIGPNLAEIPDSTTGVIHPSLLSFLSVVLHLLSHPATLCIPERITALRAFSHVLVYPKDGRCRVSS